MDGGGGYAADPGSSDITGRERKPGLNTYAPCVYMAIIIIIVVIIWLLL